VFTDFQWGSLHLDQKSAYGQVADHLINGDSGKFIPGEAKLLKSGLFGRFASMFRIAGDTSITLLMNVLAPGSRKWDSGS